MAVTADQVLAALKDIIDPSSGRTFAELGYWKHPELLDGGGVRVRVELPTPASPHKQRIEESVRAKLAAPTLPRIEVAFGANVRPSPAKRIHPYDLERPVKNVVLVGSGKVGVGKSTISAKIAQDLDDPGARAVL